MKPLLLLGAGGHCRSCIEIIEAEGSYRIVGIVDKEPFLETQILGYPILGGDRDLPILLAKYQHAMISVGQIKSAALRRRLFLLVRENRGTLPTICSPRSVYSRHARIGMGTIVMHGAIVNAGSTVGMNCIINSQSLIEHDATVGDHCHISTNAIINGAARIGEGTFVGSGAIIRESVVIGSNAIIGAGSLVLHDVKDNAVVRGSHGK